MNHITTKIYFITILWTIFRISNAQISAIFGNAVQAANCGDWTSWGPCVWLKGANPRWRRSYFEQLLPGRTGCRHHVFFQLLQDRWGTAFNNFYDYLRDVTISEQQCGECSYQQSCGRGCHRKSQSGNPLFVAERRCAGVDQSSACVSRTVNDQCQLWPPPEHLALPNVTQPMREILNSLDYLSCVPNERNGVKLCRCCCHPFAPNPDNNYQCELKPAFLAA